MLAEMETHLYSVSKPKSLSQILGLEKTALEYCAALILRYFKNGGMQLQPITIDDCMARLNVQPRFSRMFLFFLDILSQVKVATIEENRIFFLERSASLLAPEALLEKIRMLYPKFYFFFSFLDKCSQCYPEVLAGKKAATEVLFPPENPIILKKIYENTPKLGHEELYLHLAKEYLRNRLEKDSHLIEIGGGQGILTQILLPELHEQLSHYLFTDIGHSFLNDARIQWAASYPKMSTAVFDVSKDPGEQRIKAGSFDAVVGFNVVHATQNIAETLKQVAKTLKENGIICLIENVKQQAWIDMIYGLTEGWWLFNDPIRKNSPLLSIDQWEQVLRENGYLDFSALPIENIKRCETDTALIVIEKGGKR